MLALPLGVSPNSLHQILGRTCGTDTRTLRMRDPQKGVQVPGATPQYPPGFKAEAIGLVRSSGRSIPQAAKELGVSDNSLRNWIKQAEIEAGKTEELTNEEREKLRRTELVVGALEMAVWRRRPAPGLIHHSDQGVQYTALSFGKRLEEVGIVPSMGRFRSGQRHLGIFRGDAEDGVGG